MGEEFLAGDLGDGFAGVETEGEEGAHKAGKDCDGEALSEGVIGLACFGLFFGRDLVLFGDAGRSVDGDAEDTDGDAQGG